LGLDFADFVKKALKQIGIRFQMAVQEGDLLVSRSVLGFIAELTNIGVFNHFKFLKLITDLVN
jgi:hypothetical protein